MPSIEVTLPDQVDGEIDRLVDEGVFINRDQAVEELLSMGMSAYDTGPGGSRGSEEELFTQAVDDQRDPAMRNDPDSDPPAF